MASKQWSDSEIKLLGTKPDNELAAQLGRSYTSVRVQRMRRAIPAFGTVDETKETTFEQDRQMSDNAIWRSRYAQLERKYARALEETSVVRELVEEIKDLAPKSYTQLPAVVKERKASKYHTSQSAVLQFSDTHVGKVVTPKQTMGFGEYNFPIFLARLKYLEESVLSICENHMTVKVDELVVAMLGDMLDGKLIHSVEAGQRNTVFCQYYGAGHAIAQMFRNLAPHFPLMRIKTCVGNHTRWDSQKKMPTENRYSNLDMFLYALVQALTSDIKNIEWDLNQEPFALFEVKGHVFHAAHGDHLKGGDRALGIPNHAFGREVSTKSQLYSKYGKKAPNFYLTGHLHREITLPHATGTIMVNGGFPGLDNYALAENFNPVDPTQRFFFVHPKFGKTAEYSLSLKMAKVSDVRPYTIPSNFSVE